MPDLRGHGESDGRSTSAPWKLDDDIDADVNRVFQRRGGRSIQHWNLPDAGHGRAHKTDPAGYERRVIAFLDGALSQDAAGD